MNIHDSVETTVSAEPVNGVVLLQRVRAHEVRGSRRRRLAGVAVLTAAAVIGVTLVVPALTGREDRGPEPADTVVGAVAAPPGQRAVSWHGVQVFVPQQWRLGDTHCGVAQRDTVVVPGIVNSCLPPAVPGLTVVTFSDRSTELPDDLRDVEVSGVPARRGTSTPPDESTATLAVLELPLLEVVVTVRSPDPARAQALLDTAQIIEVDEIGCASSLPGPTPPDSDVPGAADRILPGEPVRVVACEYGGLRLERSTVLTAAEVDAFRAATDAAPVGTSPSRVGTEVSAELCPEYDAAPLVVQASYGDGRQLQVFTRLNSCTGPDPDNGSRRVVLPDPEPVFGLFRAVRR